MNRRFMIFYLLMISIAAAPMLSSQAAAAGHLQDMSSHCDGCDSHWPAEQLACEDSNCTPLLAGCGLQINLTAIPGSLAPVSSSGESTSPLEASACRFKSWLDFTIYRPPIV